MTQFEEFLKEKNVMVEDGYLVRYTKIDPKSKMQPRSFSLDDLREVFDELKGAEAALMGHCGRVLKGLKCDIEFCDCCRYFTAKGTKKVTRA